MEQYNVTGMSCAACSARVEKAVAKVPGVTACSVSLLTNSMGVEGTASAEDIVRAVEEAGYRGGRGAAGSRNSGFKAAAGVVFGLSAGFDVFLHGAHDVGLARSGLFPGQPRGYGAFAAAADGGGDGD